MGVALLATHVLTNLNPGRTEMICEWAEFSTEEEAREFWSGKYGDALQPNFNIDWLKDYDLSDFTQVVTDFGDIELWLKPESVKPQYKNMAVGYWMNASEALAVRQFPTGDLLKFEYAKRPASEALSIAQHEYNNAQGGAELAYWAEQVESLKEAEDV